MINLIKDLPQKAMNLLLYGNEEGSGETEMTFDTAETNGQMYATEFEGIINQLRRWFAGGTSESIQQWVEQFMELKTCDECHGARLKKKAFGSK